jgi:V8-like Glu-specific endopeptidase
MGLATQEETSVALNRVAFDILTLLTELEAGPVPSEAPVQAPSFEEDVRARPRFDKIIGINNLRQIGWIEHGLVASRAVCRILTPGGLGTGFLIDQFVLMTNNHVIPSSNVADQTKVEFNYQLALGSHAASAGTVRYDLASDKLFRTSIALDYTVVAIRTSAGAGKPPVSAWGNVLLNPNADPVRNELVVIVQHPNGQPKQIALSANAVLQVKPPYLHYSTDTMPGSSGSPVFNDLWQVVAIHHAAGPSLEAPDGGTWHSNEGILMSAIRDDLGVDWPGSI